MPHGRFSLIDRLVQRLSVRALRHADRDLIPHLTDCVAERRKAFCKLLRLTRRTQQDKLVTADTICAVIREILSNPVRNRAQHVVSGLMSQVVVDLMQADGIHINAGQPRIIRQLKDLEVVLVLAARVQMGQHIMIIVVLGMVGCMVRQLQFLFTEHDGLTVLTVLE